MNSDLYVVEAELITLKSTSIPQGPLLATLRVGIIAFKFRPSQYLIDFSQFTQHRPPRNELASATECRQFMPRKPKSTL